MRAALAFALAGASAVVASNSANVYLYPAQSAPVAPARPEVAAHALAYHLDLPDADPSVGSAKDWAFAAQRKAKDMLEDNRNRLALYVDGVDEPADVLPVQTVLRPTHKVADAPSSESWSALLASFAESAASLTDSMGLWRSTLLGIDAHEAASAIRGWFTPIVPQTFDIKFEQESGPVAHLTKEVQDVAAHLDNMVAGLDSEAEFQALRVQALGEIKRVYGAASDEYKEALSTVKSLIQSSLARLQEAAGKRGQDARFALILSSSSPSGVQKRSPAPVDALLAPFGKRVVYAAQQRAFKLAEVPHVLSSSFDAVTASNSTKADPKNFKGKCFTSAESLYEATASCSGHGTAVEKIRGAKKCFRCQCKATATSNSKTYWAGDACEKIDLSSPTMLILATAAALVFLATATIQFMLKEGDLPLSGTLASVSVPTYKL